jgi:hypothetical protein
MSCIDVNNVAHSWFMFESYDFLEVAITSQRGQESRSAELSPGVFENDGCSPAGLKM